MLSGCSKEETIFVHLKFRVGGGGVRMRLEDWKIGMKEFKFRYELYFIYSGSQASICINTSWGTC